VASNSNDVVVARWPAILFLLWTLMGCAAFIMQSMQDVAELAKTDPYQAKIWAAMPMWAWISYAVAVAAGTLGALALLTRRRVAVMLSLLCVIAVLIQFSYTFFMTDLLAVKGFSTTIFPLVIIVLAIAQLLYARALSSKGALR
jgi:hypothetical protein